MTYIKLEDVQKILIDYKNLLLNNTNISAVESFGYIKLIVKLSEDINSLPSIDFEEMIKNKINAINEGMNNIYYTPEPITGIEALEELLSNLPK